MNRVLNTPKAGGNKGGREGEAEGGRGREEAGGGAREVRSGCGGTGIYQLSFLTDAEVVVLVRHVVHVHHALHSTSSSCRLSLLSGAAQSHGIRTISRDGNMMAMSTVMSRKRPSGPLLGRQRGE